MCETNIKELKAENARLRRALDPFARVWRINLPLNPDPKRPLRDVCPGAWPTMADCKNANDALRLAEKSHA